MRFIALVFTVLGTGFVSAQPVVSFAPTEKDGERIVAGAVSLDDGRLATVAVVGADPTKATLGVDGKGEALELIVLDRVSRLAILKAPKTSSASVGAKRGSGASLKPGAEVFLTPDGERAASRIVKWENSYRGALLPVSLLRVHHPGKTPPVAGAPLYNAGGELVAICHEPAAKFGNGTFALPVEVVQTVERKHKASGSVSACWIGVSFNATDTVMAVTMVRPDSPGSRGGVKKGDIILAVAGRDVNDYADAVNAFYYLVEGRATKFAVLRGTERLELSVTPEVHPAFLPPADE